MFNFRAFIPMLLIASLLAGCPQGSNPSAVIHYSQLGSCIVAQTGNGQVSAPSSHAIVIFRIESIDNSKVNQSWSFDSTTLEINPPSQPQQNLGGLGPVAIAANQSVPINALVGIIVETDNADGSDSGSTNYFLLYPNKPPAPGTLSVKNDPNRTSYPFTPDCNTIAGQ